MFEIHPCEIVGVDSLGHQHVAQCDPRSKNIACWGLYRIDDGVLEWIEDYPTKRAAKNARTVLRREAREQIPA